MSENADRATRMDLLNLPLSSFGFGDDPIDYPLSVRTMNVLKRHGIETVGQLLNAERALFHHIPGLGGHGRLQIDSAKRILRRKMALNASSKES